MLPLLVLGLVLAATVVGLPVLAGVFAIARSAAALDRYRADALLGVRVAAPQPVTAPTPHSLAHQCAPTASWTFGSAATRAVDVRARRAVSGTRVALFNDLKVSAPDLRLPERPIAGAVALGLVEPDPVGQLVRLCLGMVDEFWRSDIVDDPNELAPPWPIPTDVLDYSDARARR